MAGAVSVLASQGDRSRKLGFSGAFVAIGFLMPVAMWAVQSREAFATFNAMRTPGASLAVSNAGLESMTRSGGKVLD